MSPVASTATTGATPAPPTSPSGHPEASTDGPSTTYCRVQGHREYPDGDDHFRGRTGPLPVRARRPDGLTPSLNGPVPCHGRSAPLVSASHGGRRSISRRTISGRSLTGTCAATSERKG